VEIVVSDLDFIFISDLGFSFTNFIVLSMNLLNSK